jgi:hypothetical protein
VSWAWSCARVCAVGVALAGVLAGPLVVSPAALADVGGPPLSALFLRNSSATVFRQTDVDGASMHIAQGTSSYGAATVPILDVTSQVGTDSSTFVSVEISAGLMPGTYATSRLPGQAAALVDPGSISQCGADEPGSLTTQQTLHAFLAG